MIFRTSLLIALGTLGVSPSFFESKALVRRARKLNVYSISHLSLLLKEGPWNDEQLEIALLGDENTYRKDARSDGYRCGNGFGKCPNGLCCSVHGFCGNSVAHCSVDCQSQYGLCADKSRRAGNRCGLAFGSQSCKEPNECCSVFGHCGTGAGFCNNKTNTDFNYSTFANAEDDSAFNKIPKDLGYKCGLQNGGKQCPDGLCCSVHGWCGNSVAHCSVDCQKEFGVCTDLNNKKSDRCGLPFGSQSCRTPGNCCSPFGWCGGTENFCKQSQETFDYQEYANPGEPNTRGRLALTGGYKCGLQNGGQRCPDGLCCSVHGWCGTSPAHCSLDCQKEFGVCTEKKRMTTGRCGLAFGDLACQNSGECCSAFGHCGFGPKFCNGDSQVAYNHTNVAKHGDLETYGKQPQVGGYKCGKQNEGKVCPDGLCCSVNGWCGNSVAHCSVDCQSEFGLCSSSLKLAGRCGLSFGSQTCQNGGECCSAFGWCGTGGDYCNGNAQSEFKAPENAKKASEEDRQNALLNQMTYSSYMPAKSVSSRLDTSALTILSLFATIALF